MRKLQEQKLIFRSKNFAMIAEKVICASTELCARHEKTLEVIAHACPDFDFGVSVAYSTDSIRPWNTS